LGKVYSCINLKAKLNRTKIVFDNLHISLMISHYQISTNYLQTLQNKTVNSSFCAATANHESKHGVTNLFSSNKIIPFY